MMPSSGISNLGICRQVSRDALDFDLPSCIGEVCPPGGHMLERGVQAQLGAKRRRGGWLSVCTSCVDSRTDRCTLCPYWRCSNDECQWEAWDNSAGLQQAWNHEAGMTVSRTLYRAHMKPFGCIYNNSEEPWGVTEGWDPPEGRDGGEGEFWQKYAGRGRVFDESQFRSSGEVGMRQWWSGWGGQQGVSSRCGRRGRTEYGGRGGPRITTPCPEILWPILSEAARSEGA